MSFRVDMPKLSPTMEEGVIAKWHRKEGDKVLSGELLLEVATDKATIEYNALDDGYLRKILVQEGEKAQVGAPIALFTEQKEDPIDIESFDRPIVEEKKEEVKEVKKASQAPLSSSQRVIASPLAKKLAKEKGIDLTTISGSGPRGRIVSKDLGTKKAVVSSVIPSGSYEEIALTPMRKVIAARLTKAKQTIPHIYVRQEIDAFPIESMREQFKAASLKITWNDFVIRAAALALFEHPEINSGFSEEKEKILRYKTIDISIAVTIPGGLITPILTHANQKSLTEISQEVRALATKAKEGKLQPHEYQGGSFTISNLGMFGVSDFCAIVNPPQAAILAVGGVEETVRCKNGAILPGKKMTLTLSADHRVIDGAEASLFIKKLQYYLENPALLVI